VRVVIAEDSALLREGLVRMLAARGHEVVAAVGDAQELLSAVREHAPDVVLADVRMPPTHTDEGLRAAVELRRPTADRGPVPVLVLSQYVEERYAVELLGGDTRGVGYLLKDRVADVGDFVAALERVASGGTALDPDVISQIFARSRRRAAIDRLTPREREVLGLMAEGRSNTAIAAALVVSDGAVEKHVSNIFSKLDLAQDADDHRRVRAVVTWLES
jgi:DNA-binding NarL/FixJ family response regulator